MWRVSPGIAWLAGAACAAIGLALAGCLAFPTRPLAGASSSPAAAAVVRAGGGGRPPRGEPRGALRRPRAAAVRSRRAVSPARIRRSHEGRRARGRRRGVDGRDPPLAHPLPPGRELSHDRRRAAVRRPRPPAAPHRGRPAQRGARAARAGRGAAPERPPGAASPAGVAAPERARCSRWPWVSPPRSRWRWCPSPCRSGWPSRSCSSRRLPFFAMHVSETALLCSIYVLLAISLAVLFGDGPGSHWAGAPLGLATGLMLAGGRSPWPLTALVAAALLGRAVLGPSAPHRARRNALVFWGGFGLGAAVFFVLLDDAYRSMTELVGPPLRALHPLRPAGRWASGSSAAPRPWRASPPSAWCWRSRRARCAPGSPPGCERPSRNARALDGARALSRWSSSPSPPRCSFRFPSSRSSRRTR